MERNVISMFHVQAKIGTEIAAATKEEAIKKITDQIAEALLFLSIDDIADVSVEKSSDICID